MSAEVAKLEAIVAIREAEVAALRALILDAINERTGNAREIQSVLRCGLASIDGAL